MIFWVTLFQLFSILESQMMRPLRQSTLIQSKMHLESPPYRKVRALRLFDTPATPKTLFKKSSFDNGSSAIRPNTQHSKLIRKSILSNVSGLAPQTPNERPKAMPIHNKALEPLSANINPFSPSSKSNVTDRQIFQNFTEFFLHEFTNEPGFIKIFRFPPEKETISNWWTM